MLLFLTTEIDYTGMLRMRDKPLTLVRGTRPLALGAATSRAGGFFIGIFYDGY